MTRQRQTRFRTIRTAIFAIWVSCALAVWSVPAQAVSLIRDAEIERALKELARPLLEAAGVSSSNMRFFLIQDGSLNAFVADQRTIIMHTGLVLKLDTPEQVQAVLAHEIAHIANGHIVRRLANIRYASRFANFGSILGLAAGIAAGEPGAAVGLSLGAAEASRRSLLSHTRAEEAAADQAAARYMARARIDPGAMVDVLMVFRGQEALSTDRQDPYVRSHPLTRDRLRAAQGLAAAYGVDDPVQTDNAYWYARLQGKLASFIRNPKWTLRRVPASDTSEVARMQRAIAHHKNSDTARAVNELNALLKMRPNDPYYTELMGQVLFESRRYPQAVQYYRRAVSLAPNQPLIRASYGRALLALNTRDATDQALRELRSAYSRDPENLRLLRDLAQAYARTGQNGMASITTAERYALAGNLKDAAVHARRAVGLLPTGSPGHTRALDLIRAEQLENR